MANELTITLTVRANKGNFDYTFPSSGSPFSADWDGDDFSLKTQDVGTSEEALALGDVDPSSGNGALLYIINRDPTNFVTLRPATGAADMAKLPPGLPALLFLDPTDAAAPFVIANTAACRIEYFLIEAQ